MREVPIPDPAPEDASPDVVHAVRKRTHVVIEEIHSADVFCEAFCEASEKLDPVGVVRDGWGRAGPRGLVWLAMASSARQQPSSTP